VSDATNPRPRRPYTRPVIEEVKLVPEEAVLGSCKAPSLGGGPGTSNCKLRGQPCSGQGS
jgi:hypothetical protein